MLDHGVDMDARDKFDRNALHMASSFGHETIAKLLFDKGADVTAQHRECDNALHLASSGGYQKIIELLLES